VSTRDQSPLQKTNQATRIVEFCDTLGLELWHSPARDPWVTLDVSGHHENWPLGSREFGRHISTAFYSEEGAAPAPQALASALRVLEGRAGNSGREQHLFNRVAGVAGDPSFYIDLCDSAWQSVEISSWGWQVVTSYEVPLVFRRAPGMAPLPLPERGGSLEELRRFINVGTDDDFILLVSWLVGVMRPTGPYPVLGLYGQQGSAKTTTARILRALVDPNTAPTRAEPSNPRDLQISARNSWVLAYDNLSRLPAWLSDALCRISTGGGFSVRALYTDDSETIFEGQRPVLLNGINEVTTRGDLLDRTILVSLPPIDAKHRMTESDLWAAFDCEKPRLFGALLDALVGALANERVVEMDLLPRMADFARWVVAAEPNLPWAPGRFLGAYGRNRGVANSLALEASPLALPVGELVCSSPWTGTATELLTALSHLVSESIRSSRDWPKSAKSLSGKLRRLAPNFAAVGVQIEFSRSSGSGSKKEIHIQLVDQASDACDACDAKVADTLEPNYQRQDASQDTETASDADSPRANCPGGVSDSEPVEPVRTDVVRR
jgi:hypothetical protein